MIPISSRHEFLLKCVLATVLVALLFGQAIAADASPRDGKGPTTTGFVVAIFSRSADGRTHERGSGFVANPGVVVTSRDERRSGVEVFIRLDGVERLLEATPVTTDHATELDVYTFRMPSFGGHVLALSAKAAGVGDRVVSHALGVGGATELAGRVLQSIGKSLLEVEFATPPRPEFIGGPVLGTDNSVVGVLTSKREPGGGYLVVSVASVKLRLAGEPEPETGNVGSSTVAESSPRPDPPPKPIVTSPWPPVEGPLGDPVGVPGPPANPPPPPPVSRVVTKPRAQNSPRPAYTEQARTNGTEGRVLVRVTVGTNGRVHSASIVKGLPDGLNAKALEAAQRLEFDPARNAAGEPVESTLTVAVDFRISWRDVTGVWAATRLEGQPTVQFFLERVSETERRGLVLIERGQRDYVCVAFTGSYGDGRFAATATVAEGSCTYRWIGILQGEEFNLQEVRTCGEKGEPVTRSMGLAKIR